ncbi:hypothetical protein JCM10207_007452 [Rhodosporidiobolus poonsookiae]
MVSERFVRFSVVPLTTISFILSVVTLGLSASLEAHWAKNGFPNGSYRDRERILLAASIWGFLISIYSLVGTFFFPDRLAFGIFFHLIAFGIAFILYMIGSASLVALTDKIDCSDVDWSRCGHVKALVGFGWTETIIVFVLLMLVLFLGIKARSGVGMRKGALTDA